MPSFAQDSAPTPPLSPHPGPVRNCGKVTAAATRGSSGAFVILPSRGGLTIPGSSCGRARAPVAPPRAPATCHRRQIKAARPRRPRARARALASLPPRARAGARGLPLPTPPRAPRAGPAQGAEPARARRGRARGLGFGAEEGSPGRGERRAGRKATYGGARPEVGSGLAGAPARTESSGDPHAAPPPATSLQQVRRLRAASLCAPSPRTVRPPHSGASAWLPAVISPPASMRFGSKMMPVSGRAVGARDRKCAGSWAESLVRVFVRVLSAGVGMAAAGGLSPRRGWSVHSSPPRAAPSDSPPHAPRAGSGRPSPRVGSQQLLPGGAAAILNFFFFSLAGSDFFCSS